MNRTLLIPVAGNFQNTNNKPPYIFTNSPTGNLPILESLLGLNLEFFDTIVIILLRKYYDQIEIEQSIENVSFENSIKDKIKIHILEQQTSSQPETIARALKELNINGFICVKDPDNQFQCNITKGNYIATLALDTLEYVNPKHKSYLMLDENGYITNIIEQKIIGRYFCTGLYCFEKAEIFLDYFNKLSSFSNLYMSHIIYRMLLDNISFRTLESTNYLDWGTLHDWELYCSKFQTHIFKLDDLFFQGTYLSRDKQRILDYAKIEVINNLFNQGKNKILIITELPDQKKVEINKFLLNINLKFHKILTEIYLNIN
jgi:hypothetical protein